MQAALQARVFESPGRAGDLQPAEKGGVARSGPINEHRARTALGGEECDDGGHRRGPRLRRRTILRPLVWRSATEAVAGKASFAHDLGIQ